MEKNSKIKEIIAMWNSGYTMTEIASIYSLSKERISQLIRRARKYNKNVKSQAEWRACVYAGVEKEENNENNENNKD